MRPLPDQHDASMRFDEASHTVQGRVELRRVGRWRFPAYDLINNGAEVGSTGPLGWFRIFLGPGVRVELSDASRWRIRSATLAGFVCPVVVDGQRRKVAVAAPGAGNYGVSGRDFGYGLYPQGRHRSSSSSWTLREYEENVAVLHRRPLVVEAAEPVHLAAVLVSFVLMRYGIPDDARPRMPSFSWG